MLKTNRSRWYTLMRDPWMIFSSHKTYLNISYTFYDEMHTWGVYFSLCTPTFVTTTFNIWIRKGALDTLVLLIKKLTLDCKPNHMTIGFFETKKDCWSWSYWSIASFAWRIWSYKQNHILCQRQKKNKNNLFNDNCFQVDCELWCFGDLDTIWS